MKFSKHRLEFFSDGMMAIIMTIMVLEIPVPKHFSIESLGELLNSLLIFFISFFIVSGFLYKHHHLMDHVKIITSKIIWKNFLFLFFVALLPVFTKLIIENTGNNMAIILYDINFILANIFMIVLAHEARKQFIDEDVEWASIHKDMTKRKFANIRFAISCIVFLGMVVLSIIFPKFSIIMFIVFPILFNLLNIFRDDSRKLVTDNVAK